ncbi:hypothetical protein SH139x_005394 [Planctomycetaceae bacterium SH139]
MQTVDFVSLGATVCRATSLELLTRYSIRDFAVEMKGPPKFLGNPDVHLLMFFDPGRTM